MEPEKAETIPLRDSSSRKKNTFAGDVLKLTTGTAFAQMLVVLSTPILTRLFNPEAFGTFNIYASIVNVIGVIACLRYELAIVLPKTDEEGANILGLSLFFSIIVSLVLVPIVWFVKIPVLTWMKALDLEPFWGLVILSVLFTGFFTALNYWNTRTKDFGRLSIAKAGASLVMVASQLGAGFVGWVSGGSLITGNIVGLLTSTGILGVQIWRDDGNLFRQSIRPAELWRVMLRYYKFPLVSSWAGVLNTISWQVSTFLLAFYFDKTVVGFYALGNNVLRMPMNLIGASIAQAFFSRASEAKNNGNLQQLVESTFRQLVSLSLFPLLLLTIIAPELFIVFFGKNWAEAGVYTQILSIWMFFWFISSPLSNLYFILEKQEFILNLNIAIFITRVLSLLIGGVYHDAHLALILFAISGILTYGYLSIAIVVMVGIKFKTIFKILSDYTWPFVPVGLVLWGAKALMVPHWIIVLLGALGTLGFYIWLLKNNPAIYHQILQMNIVRRILSKFRM